MAENQGIPRNARRSPEPRASPQTSKGGTPRGGARGGGAAVRPLPA